MHPQTRSRSALAFALAFTALAAPAAHGSALVIKDDLHHLAIVQMHIVFYGDGDDEVCQSIVDELDTLWNGPDCAVDLVPGLLPIKLAPINVVSDGARVVIREDGAQAARRLRELVVGPVPYTVVFEFTWERISEAAATRRAAGNTAHRENYIRIAAEWGRHDHSYVDGIGSNSGVFLTRDWLGLSTTAAHEVGHLLGLGHPATTAPLAGQPGIMWPRGTLVDARYQYNARAAQGDHANGGTLDPRTRQVLCSDVEDLGIASLPFANGRDDTIGFLTNRIHVGGN